jgi:transcriptional regulator with XRE-family HTH domain
VPRSHRSDDETVDGVFARSADCLAANVRVLRERAGLTQQALAEQAEISVNYLQKVERAAVPLNVTLKLLATLATALDVGVHDLVAPAAVPRRRPPGRPRANRAKKLLDR